MSPISLQTRVRRALLGGVAVALTLSSALADAQQSGDDLAAPVPAAPVYMGTPYVPSYVPPSHRPIVGYRTETRARTVLWGTGLGLFLAGYVLDWAALTPLANAISEDRAGADEEDAWAWSLLPLAGPVIQLAIGAPHPAIPITTGLMQLAGMVLFIWGLTDQETVRIPVRAGDPDDPSIPTLGFDASPLPGGGEVRVSLAHL